MPRLCVIHGDGIGREVVPVALRVLETVVPGLEITEAEAGWACFERTGSAVPETTLAAVRECGAALFGAVASPSRPVAGYRSAILTLRQQLGLYASVRPVRSLPRLSPRAGINLLIVRENSEGLYVGRERGDREHAVAERVVSAVASRRLARLALSLARTGGRGRLTIVHKANVLPLSDGLFRDCVREVVDGDPITALEVDELLVDTAALRLVEAPETFDMIITTNLYGDILSDVASYWGGGLRTAPSLNLGDGIGIAEPVHGAAPDIAGSGRASPIAAILSAALLARVVWERPEAATRIERAVEAYLDTRPCARTPRAESLTATATGILSLL